MKKLSKITYEDAKEVIKSGYSTFFHTGRWKLRDDSEALKEPCATLYSKVKSYEFTFYNDSISIDFSDQDNWEHPFDSANFDTKLACYVKAYELGYDVPEFKKLSCIRKHPISKVSDETAIEIKRDRKSGMKHKDVAEKYGITIQDSMNICTRYYKHVNHLV